MTRLGVASDARLGAAQAAAFGGLSPAAAGLFGLLLLGEVPDGATSVGVMATGLGVVLVSQPLRAPSGTAMRARRKCATA